MTVDLRHGNCLDILPTLPDCSVDSIVTDPPYELGFMGKKWDNSGIAYNVTLWQECLRVLKPGGHLLAFGGTRTYHRMACAIEDAGFEIRDSIHWIYGSGFPKSLDVSKAIDKRGGNAHLTKEVGQALKAARKSRGITASQADREYCGGVTLWSWYEGRPAGQQMPTSEIMWAIANDWPELRKYAELIDEAEREIICKSSWENSANHFTPGEDHTERVTLDITAPATDAAKQWAGWGTALKPAHEPIVVARRPLTGTVAANVLEYGTGAINIDASRIAGGPWKSVAPNAGGRSGGVMGKHTEHPGGEPHSAGRWPANVIIDDAIVNSHDDWPRYFYCAKPSRKERNAGLDELPKEKPLYTSGTGLSLNGDGTLRSTISSNQNHHPTVKPLALMRYLVRLVTPPNGTVLEPFAGSGTTLMACVLEGFNAIGIEMTDEYLPIIEGRVAWAEQQTTKQSPQQELPL